MARPKGDDETRDAERSTSAVPNDRPGAYVQVAGTPRRRKSAGAIPRVDHDPDESSGVKSGTSDVYQPAPSSIDHGTDDVRRNPGKPAARRNQGPLGMGDARPERAVVVRDEPPRELVDASVRESLREFVQDAAPPSAPQSSSRGFPDQRGPERSVVAPAQRVKVVEINGPEASSANSNVRADMVVASASAMPMGFPSDVPEPSRAREPTQSESVRPLPTASVLDALPSLRPEPVVKPSGPSWGLLFGVAILCSIIAAAAVVAIQEVVRPAPSLAVTPGEPAQPTNGAAQGVPPAVAAPAAVVPASPAPPVAATTPAPSALPTAPPASAELTPAPAAAAPAEPVGDVAPEPAAPVPAPEPAASAPLETPAVHSAAPRANVRPRPGHGHLAPAAPQPAAIVVPADHGSGADDELPANPYAEPEAPAPQ